MTAWRHLPASLHPYNRAMSARRKSRAHTAEIKRKIREGSHSREQVAVWLYEYGMPWETGVRLMRLLFQCSRAEAMGVMLVAGWWPHHSPAKEG
ncbi:hypothetical protein D3C75_1103410 [compost metagenome]